MSGLTVAIVGAGIGGLTAALTLARTGADVILIERRTGFTPAGAGIQLSPNASRVLFDLGLGNALARAAAEPARVQIRALASGRDIGAVALKPLMRERFGAPYLVVHRADLQTLLLDAARSRATIRLLMGRRAVAVEDGPDRARVTVETAAGVRETLTADVAVGADGIGSVVRAALGETRAPVFQKAAAWRAAIPRERAPVDLAGPETGLWLGRAGHVVHYPVAGGRLVNVVAVQPQAAPLEGWSSAGDPTILQHALAGAAPRLRALLAAAPDWQVWSLYDLSVRRMARGRIALLGDAAHPVLPYLAQGGALAIEDAVLFARHLAGGGEPGAALARYASDRLGRVRRVQRAARRNGKAYHAPAPIALIRDAVIRRLGPEGMSERYAWLYGWTAPAPAR